MRVTAGQRLLDGRLPTDFGEVIGHDCRLTVPPAERLTAGTTFRVWDYSARRGSATGVGPRLYHSPRGAEVAIGRRGRARLGGLDSGGFSGVVPDDRRARADDPCCDTPFRQRSGGRGQHAGSP